MSGVKNIFKSLELTVLFARLGPYHHARLLALSKRCVLTSIEISSVDSVYAWNEVKGPLDYQCITLFDDTTPDTKPVGELRNALWENLDRSRPRVIAIPGWGSKAALCALEWSRLNNCPVVLMSDSQEIDESRIWLKEWVKRRLVHQVGAGLVAGKRHVDYLASLGLPIQRILIGYDVVDNKHFTQGAGTARSNLELLSSRKSLPKKFFINCSRFIAKKNLAHLIGAYALYQKKVDVGAWHLVILGDGPLRKEIEEQISNLGMQDWVHLPGFKQYDELPAYYSLAGAYVQASTTEQWGLVVNEAMASGLPVLVSDRCGCVPDLVQSGVNGYTFDPYDVEELAGLMLKLAGGECDLKAMGQASQKIIAFWTPETFAENLLAAAHMATEAPLPKFSGFDRLLLKCLIHR